jgi:hypothetical protein
MKVFRESLPQLDQTAAVKEPPNWQDGAIYLGRDSTEGFNCHVWTLDQGRVCLVLKGSTLVCAQ